MQRLIESIEIQKPAKDVFAFLCDLEARARLNPSFTVIGFEPLTHKEMCPGARYRFFLLSNGKRTKYECEIVEFVENKKIVSRAMDGSVQLALTLQESDSRTLLTHDEKFTIPPDALETKSSTNIFQKLWQKANHVTSGLGVYDEETKSKIREIEGSLRSNLRICLQRIKEKLESEPSL